jgi:hypothetical protein
MNNLLVAEFVKLLPVVVGASAAILASCIAQYLGHRFTEKRDLAKTRREKIEALVQAVYSHGQWLDEKRNRMIWRGEDHDAVNPLDDVRMLTALYFPELRQELVKILSAQIDLVRFIHQQRIKRLGGSKEFLDEWDSAPFDEAYGRYLAAVGSLVDRAASLGRK